MSTTKIWVKNNRFEDFEDRYNVSFSETNYRGNGWDVKINDSRILAICERNYGGDTYTVLVMIQKDKMITKLKKNGNVLSKKQKRIEYDGNGMIGLSGGNVRERYGYWRDNTFLDFLGKHHLTAIQRMSKCERDENGNIVVHIRNAYHGGGSCESALYTDGKVSVKEVQRDNWQKTNPHTSAYEVDAYFVVKDAKAIIVRWKQAEYSCWNTANILYTDVEGIEAMEELIIKCEKYD